MRDPENDDGYYARHEVYGHHAAEKLKKAARHLYDNKFGSSMNPKASKDHGDMEETYRNA